MVVQIIDGTTGQPIPFVNIAYEGISEKGTSADYDGLAFIDPDASKYTFTAIGYGTKVFNQNELGPIIFMDQVQYEVGPANIYGAGRNYLAQGIFAVIITGTLILYNA